MGRTVVMLGGLAGGVVAAGIVVGLLIPLAPAGWRTPPIVWGASVIVVALCVGAAYLLSRPSRE